MCSFTSFTAPALATDCIRTFHFRDNQTFHLSDHWLEKEGMDVDVACHHVIDVFSFVIAQLCFPSTASPYGVLSVELVFIFFHHES